MNKSEFIDMVASKAEMSRTAAARAVDAIFNTASGAIAEAVDVAGHVSIPGFGKFTRRTRAARSGRNPRTGTAIEIPERTSVAFTPGRGLRNLAAAEVAAPAAKKAATKKAAKKAAGGSTTKKAAAAKSGGGKAKGAARAQKSK